MSSHSNERWAWVARIAFAFAATGTLIGGAVAARHLVAQETTQAHVLLEEGRQALARSEPGAAALAVERARWLAPRDAAVRSALATSGVSDPEPLVQRAFRLLTSREWFVLAVTAGWLVGLGLAAMMARHRTQSVRWSTIASGTILAIAVGGVAESNVDAFAIVTAPDAALLVAPYELANREQLLPAGTMVVLGSTYDDFVQARGGNGINGWARRSSLERIANSED